MTTYLNELAWLFLVMGSIAFGGPAAQIGTFGDEVVLRNGQHKDIANKEPEATR